MAYWLFEPRLVNQPLRDPVLFVRLRDLRRALLFDLGDVAALRPRELMRVQQVFVSHAHMDHFAGFDPMLRALLGRKTTLSLWGPAGFIERVEHKLRAYDWNMVCAYAVALELQVHELKTRADGGAVLRRACFGSRDGFARRDLEPLDMHGDVLFEDALLRVRACELDHGVVSLGFALEQKADLRLDAQALRDAGLGPGPWLQDLRRAVIDGAADRTPIVAAWRDRTGSHHAQRELAQLRHVVLEPVRGQRLGYVTDLRYTLANVRALRRLLDGVDTLYIETVFLDRHRDHARRKNHLTARQAGCIARRLGARRVQTLHISPRYAGQEAAVTDELQQAWRGAARRD